MSENKKSTNSNITSVVAKLVAKHDITPEEAPAAASVQLLCIYEFEHDGKKYKYRTHQIGYLEPIPETIELGFIDDPNEVRKITDFNKDTEQKSGSVMSVNILIAIGLLIVFYSGYIVYTTLSDAISDLDIYGIPGVLIFVVIFIINKKAIDKRNEKIKNCDAMIEDAMLNNRTVIAHRIKVRHRSSFDEDRYLEQYYHEYPYVGKYTYTYNGKKYKVTYTFHNYPPASIRVFFNKSPKDVFTFITPTKLL